MVVEGNGGIWWYLAKLGIFDITQITEFPTEMEISLLHVVMPFWDATINRFVFPFGMILPTIYDLLVMFGLSTKGEEFCHNPLETHFGTECNFSSGNLTTYIQ